MAGLVAFTLAGLGYLVVAGVETLAPNPHIRRLSASLLSSLVLVSALISALLPSPPHEPLGAALSLPIAAAAALFLLHSLAGTLIPSLPPPILSLLLLSAFLLETLLLFALRRKDPDALESRYLELLIPPAALCAAATLAGARRPAAARLARAAGLALHGTWLVQMGFSFFTTAMSHGCSLHRRGGLNFTIKCKSHADGHRGKAIATLQFNCHLALLVVIGVGLYAAVVRVRGDGKGYRPLSKEMERVVGGSSRFSLDSDDDEEIVGGSDGSKRPGEVVLPISRANGSH